MPTGASNCSTSSSPPPAAGTLIQLAPAGWPPHATATRAVSAPGQGCATAQLPPLRSLATVYFEHNPIARDWDYRIRMKRMLPALEQIDAVGCATAAASPTAAAAAAAAER